MRIEQIKQQIKLEIPRKYWGRIFYHLDQLTPDGTADEMRGWSETYRDTAKAQKNRWDRYKDPECYYYHEGRREQAQAFIDVFGEVQAKPDPWSCYLRFAKEMGHDNA